MERYLLSRPRVSARFLLALSLTASLAACGDSEDGNGDDGADAADTSGGDAGTDADSGTEDTGGTDTTEDTGGTDTTEDTGGTDTNEDSGPDIAFDVITDADRDSGGTDTGGTDTGGTDATDATIDVVIGEGLVVFDDDYQLGITGFTPFGGAGNVIVIDSTEGLGGTGSSISITVGAAGYTGGALVAPSGIDASAYNALSFWAKADSAKSLNVAGAGNDAAGSPLAIERRQRAAADGVAASLQMTTEWQQYLIPLPNPGAMGDVLGAFHFAEGSEEGPYRFWIDQIEFVDAGDRIGETTFAAFGTVESTLDIGSTTQAEGMIARAVIDGNEQELFPGRGQYVWSSDNADAAVVDEAGIVTGVGEGVAVISATFGGIDAAGTLTLTVGEAVPDPVPEDDAPDTGLVAAQVIAAVFSDEFTEVTVNTYAAGWGQFGAQSIVDLNGDAAGGNALLYEDLNFVGMEMIGANALDVSAATNVRVSLWTPDATLIGFKLVDAGANGALEGPRVDDDLEGRLAFLDISEPPLVTGEWVTYDFPLAAFVDTVGGADPEVITTEHLSQIILDALVGATPGVADVYVDNLIFYTTAVP